MWNRFATDKLLRNCGRIAAIVTATELAGKICSFPRTFSNIFANISNSLAVFEYSNPSILGVRTVTGKCSVQSANNRRISGSRAGSVDG